ncbi:MAG: hypothetical protein NUW08_04260 [Candidatus Uhrbacteria bacterium]|nr:hypothetical protein [Candidatus Uhrbacteria bacterium]
MAKQKSPFLSSFGVAFQVLKSITDAVLAEGGSDDDLRSLLSDPDKCRRVALEIVGRKPVVQDGSPYRGGQATCVESGFWLEVVYAQPSYADLKKAFDWVYDGCNSAKFTSIDVCKDVSMESCEIEFELVHLDKELSTDAILVELKRLEFRPALYEELLAFAKQYPDEQRMYPIVALGSVCQDDDDLCSPYVHEYDDGRRLDLHQVDGPRPWLRYCRFLVVRK